MLNRVSKLRGGREQRLYSLKILSLEMVTSALKEKSDEDGIGTRPVIQLNR